MGYLRPLVQRTPDKGRNIKPVLALAGGFIFSALLIHGTLWIVGSTLVVEIETRWMILAVFASIVTIIDLVFGKDLMPALSWKRQTPRQAFFQLGPTKGALLWGLDTGLAFTTYRTTSLPWIGFGAAFLNLIPWWGGILYGLGFIGPILFDIFLPSKSATDTGVYTSRVAGFATPIQITGRLSIVLLALAGAWQYLAV